MNDRDRLIELIADIQNDFEKWCVECAEDGHKDHQPLGEYLADKLLANGVIVSMCYIGQPMWYVYKSYNGRVEIRAGKISMIQQKADKSWKFRFSHNSSVWDFKTEDIGVKYFTTKEEAENALKEREQNG